MKRAILLVILFLTFGINIYADKTVNLFTIERSKNANVVKYDAVLKDDGSINEKRPVDVYWLLYAYKNGEREELSAFDKKAYGFKVKHNAEKEQFDFTLKSVKDKPMILVLDNNVPKAVIKINNVDCFLEKVYIDSTDGAFGIPKVNYYELFGKEVNTDNIQQQKILVK
ncbi:DUF4833 domain-containing protein [Candidatus Ruminimicrobiellum ovillum]|uniref:DUF4833 domain-containing protein n=1 Tax=Candidatus Ruminimicrobiellum ovillum TaxID=1947927 RepID=UPI0035595F4F